MENRRSSEHIACSAEFDNEYVLGYRLIIFAAIAMNSFALVWGTGNVATKVAAIGMVDERVVT